MKLKLKFSILLLLSTVCINAQTIKGIVSYNNEAIPYVSIIIKDAGTDSIIAYTSTNQQGYYNMVLKGNYTNIIVEAKSIKYEPFIKKIELNPNQIDHVFDITLSERVTQLQEVIVKQEVRAIKQKNDTTFYNINKFKDGSEKVVEDIIKKLPGIKVDEKGEIEFKGKKIRKMLLDGDDLFDSNYTLGSKNIDIDMIENIQAVENYNENKLLKGLDTNEDVVLNLKLKKHKTDLSGSLDIGLGYKDKKNVSANFLIINSRMKSFALSSFNDVGINKTPYDYQSSVKSLSAIQESDYHANLLLDQGSFYSVLDDKYHRINKNFYSSFNTLFSLGKKTKFKSNIDYYNDKLLRKNENKTEYSFNNENISLTTIQNITKKPELFNYSYQLNHFFSDSLQLEYTGKIEFQKIKLNSFSTNNTDNSISNTNSENLFTKHLLTLSKRFNKYSAGTSSIFYANDRAPQSLFLSPGFDLLNANTFDVENSQKSTFKKEYLEIKSEYLFKRKSFLFNFSANYNFINNSYDSYLEQYNSGLSSIMNSDFINTSKYTIASPSIMSRVAYKYKRFELKSEMILKYIDFKNNDYVRNLFQSGSEFLILPKTTFRYKINRSNSVSLVHSLNQIVPSEDHFFQGLVLTDFRNFRNNIPNFALQKKQTFSFNYMYYDLFYFDKVNFTSTYETLHNNYFSKTNINNDYTSSTVFLSNLNTENLNFDLGFEKYFDFIKLNVKFDTSYMVNFGKNIINNSDLRNISSKAFLLDLRLIPAFVNSKFYIDNKTTYSINSFLLENKLINQISSIKNSNKLMINLGSNFRSVTTYSILFQDIKQNSNISFLDTEITYTPEKGNMQYAIVGRNLTNQKQFNSITVSDYYSATSSHNLMPLYVLLSVNFGF